MMHHKLLLLAAAAAFPAGSLALPFGALSLFAATPTGPYVKFGPTSAYVSENQPMAAGNGGYNQTAISPATGYSGPVFWGGVTVSDGGGMGTWGVMNNYVSTAGLDSIRGRRDGLFIGDSATFVIVFPASETFSIDNANSTFFLRGRRDGGGTAAGVTGVRWLLHDTSGNYYVSALNDSSAAQFGSSYDANPGVTGSSLVDLPWYNYSFADGFIGGPIADTAFFFANTQFVSAGFRYTTQRQTNGAVDMMFAEFTMTNVPAIPELDTPAPAAIFTAVELVFTAENGRFYQIQQSSDLQTWEDVGGVVAGTGQTITRFYSTRQDDRRFFRVLTTSD